MGFGTIEALLADCKPLRDFQAIHGPELAAEPEYLAVGNKCIEF